jgi:sortase A
MSRHALRWLGTAILLSGLGLLGWLGWQYLGTSYTSNRTMDQLEQDLRQRWAPASRPPAAETPAPTGPFALIRIPRFGEEWEKPVLEGVTDDDLAKGIGHFPDTQLPGRPGNFAVAAHRVTHGSAFRWLLKLRPGDEVIVETQDAVYTYVMDTSPRDLTLKPSDSWVLQPVPGHGNTKATKSIITLTTCQDLFRSSDRSVGFGHLSRVVKKT